MDRMIDQLLEDMQSGRSPMGWVTQNRTSISPLSALAARERFEQAFRTGDLNRAFLAAHLASILHVAIGNKYESLVDRWKVAYIQYLGAQTEESYIDARETAAALTQMASQIGARDIQFSSGVLAADCAFFIMQQNRGKQAELWAVNALRDVTIATQFIRDSKDPLWFQQFSRLMMALSDAVDESPSSQVNGPISYRADVKEMLGQIVGSMEASIPVDFVFPNDQGLTINFNNYLVKLSIKYGSQANGNARSEKLLEFAKRTQQLDLWLFLLSGRYSWTRNARGYGQELAQLRRAMCTRIEDYRQQYRSRAGRILVSQQLQNTYGEFLRDSFTDSTTSQDELFFLIESTKSRTLLDQMAAGRIKFPTVAVQQHIQSQERRILRYGNQIPDDIPGIEMNLLSQLPLVGTKRDDEELDPLIVLEDFYRTHHTGLETTQSPASLSDVIQGLQPDEAIVEFCIPYHQTHPTHQVWILVITTTGVELIPTHAGEIQSSITSRITVNIDGESHSSLDTSDLIDLVWKTRVQIQQRDDAAAQQNLCRLHQLLIDPLLARGWNPGNFKRWIIIPHGSLHFIPWVALMDESKKYLIEKVALTVVPSASIWLRLLSQRSPITSFLGLANPNVTYLDFPPLPEAERELASIQKALSQLQKYIFVGAEASKANIHKYAGGCGIIHIAAHGVFPSQDFADTHQILLAAGNEGEGRLYAEELRQIEFSTTQFMALSICNGGIYRIGPGDEPYGLVSALLSAGVQNILATLWAIDSRTSTHFMIEYYDHLLKYGPADALQRTCLQFIHDEAILSQWAGFVLVGPGRKLRVELGK